MAELKLGFFEVLIPHLLFEFYIQLFFSDCSVHVLEEVVEHKALALHAPPSRSSGIREKLPLMTPPR